MLTTLYYLDDLMPALTGQAATDEQRRVLSLAWQVIVVLRAISLNAGDETSSPGTSSFTS